MSPVLNKRPFEAYRGQAQYVFVSYSHRDSDAVYPELARLKKLGFNVWYDEGISPGSHWSDELAERINNCALFVFMVTPRSVASRNCLDEANYVLDTDTPFLAVHLEETELPAGLKLRAGSRQAILHYEHEPLSYESKLYAAVAAHAASPNQAKTDVALGFGLGPYKVEPLRGAVTGPGDETHHLEPKVMDVFVCLARRPNELVTRDALLAAVWTGQVAADELLTRAVSELRRILGGAKFIETVPKRGYRLVGEVQPIKTVEPELAVESRTAAATPGHKWTYAALGVVALVIAIVAIDRYFPDTTREPILSVDDHTSTTETTLPPAVLEYAVAVLPFDNLSSNPEQEYFVDGMHAEVIATLARIESLTIISRTSVMQYKEERKPMPVIGEELNVGWVVEGTVRRAGNTIKVTVQLYEALADRHLWGDSFERELIDILVLQSEVALAIAEAIQVELTPEDDARLTDTHQPAPDAYDAYLKGNYFLNMGLGGQTLTAVSFLEQSVAADPMYAEAHAALALAYINDLELINDDLERQEWIAKAETAAQRALELDESLTEAHLAHGRVEEASWNWNAASEAYRRALDSNPNLAVSHSAYGNFLGRLGYLDEALHHMKKAHRLAPLSPGINQALGWVYLWRAEYDDAIDQFRLILDMDPDHGIADSNLAYTYADAGMVEQFFPNETEELDCSGLEMLAWAYVRRGQQAFAEDAYRESLEQCPLGEGAGAVVASSVYLILRDEEKTLELLRRSFERRKAEFVLETRFPWFDSLREHPEFMEMMRESGLDKAAVPFSETHKRTSSQ